MTILVEERVDGNEKRSVYVGGRNVYSNHFPNSCLHFGSKIPPYRAMLDLSSLCIVYLWLLY